MIKGRYAQIWFRGGMARAGNYWSGLGEAWPGQATIDQVWEMHGRDNKVFVNNDKKTDKIKDYLTLFLEFNELATKFRLLDRSNVD